MELLMINESKLKIMMTKEDLAEFDLCADELDYCNTETKRMLWDLLNRAKHTLGFDTDGYRVLVQLYPSRTGSCELFVTKVSSIFCDEEDEDLFPEPPLPDDGKKVTCAYAFGFEKLEDMLAACHRLRETGYCRSSRAYIGDNRRYYLFLESVSQSAVSFPNPYAFVLEYGTAENHEATAELLCEHGNVICTDNAVEQLGIL